MFESENVGIAGQKRAASLLRRRGISVQHMSYAHPFDLLANGKRVEVKTARKATKQWRWKVNIARHGVVREDQVDIYMILLDFRKLGKKKPLVLFAPAPIGAQVIDYTIETLLTTQNWQIENWEVFGIDRKAYLLKDKRRNLKTSEKVIPSGST